MSTVHPEPESRELDDGLAAYLFVGDEYLVRKGAEALVKQLLPSAAVGLNYVVLDGASPREVAMELLTLPLFPGAKVVMLRDPEFLAPKKGKADGMARAREAWRAGRRKEGARRLLALAARAGWGAAELDPTAPGSPDAQAWLSELNVELAELDVAFLKEVAAFCKDEGMTAPEGDVAPLVEALATLHPERSEAKSRELKGQMLVVAASDVDPKNALFRWIADHGRIVERRVEQKLDKLDIGELAREVLAPVKKRLSRDAEEELKDRCGGSMRLLHSELQKLALYVEGGTIEKRDVELLVAHARDEEFLELSDALQKKDVLAAMKYVEDAMGEGISPAQIGEALKLVGAIASITRTLVDNHERLQAYAGGVAPKSYDQFKSQVFPKIEQELKAAKAKVPHPFAAFNAMKGAAQYGRVRLLASLVACAETDFQLKSSAPAKTAIERLLWTVCG